MVIDPGSKFHLFGRSLTGQKKGTYGAAYAPWVFAFLRKFDIEERWILASSDLASKKQKVASTIYSTAHL